MPHTLGRCFSNVGSKCLSYPLTGLSLHSATLGQNLLRSLFSYILINTNSVLRASSLSPKFSSCLLRDFRPSLESFTDSRVQEWVGRPRGELLGTEGLPRLGASSEGCGHLGLDRFPSYDMEHASDPQRARGRGEAWLCHLMNEGIGFQEPREMVLWSTAT